MNSHGPVVDGRYRLVSRIGSGGMADVYLAEDLQLGRQVALKVLHRRFAEDQEFVERFRREAQSAAGLSHPNVVSVFDRGEWDGTYYIAMEYLPGRSLKTIVREHGALDPGTAIDIVLQILRAARFAHQRGIIHRDLKPHNVILDGEGRVRVTDFGIARAGASDMTQTGSIMGTAQYLSPEQAQGQPVSEASDLYSIGIVLYELLTGVLPFDGETAVTIALKQVSQQPTPPSAINPAVSAALDAIVLCALAKDPAQRFANADQFTAALTQARAGYGQDAGATARLAPTAIPALSPVPAYGAGFGPPLAPPPGYGAMVGPPSTGSWVAPVSLTAMYTTPPGYQLTGERSVVYAPVRTNSGAWRWWVAAAVALIIIAAVGVYLLLRPKQGTVPALAQCETLSAASAALEQVHLLSEVEQQTSSACPVGRVLDTSPAAGTVLARNAAVTLYVAAAVPHKTSKPARKPPAKPVVHTIPSVANEPDQQAYTQLENAGFTPQVQQAPSTSVPKGFVISTSPAGGTQGRANSAVNVLVSTGPMQETVPSVTGKSATDAAGALSAAHLSVGTITTQPSSSPAGTVLTQSVQPGSMLPQGSGVNLVVAAAPALVAVPDELGQQSSPAADALYAAGYAVSARTRAVTDPSQSGIVVGQHPRPGKMVKHGSTVVITIGTLTTSTTTSSTTTTSSSTTSSTSSTTSSTTTPTSSTTTTTTTPTTATTTSGAATTTPAGTTGPPGA